MTAAGIVCTSCGAEPLRAGARYCDACGSALTGQHAHAEFKQVTVLFADVVGSMEIAAAVGAERLREIMAGLVGRGAAIVQRYGGTMDKFTGDGLMAMFGAPVALEDHAIRACLAALDMQTETRRLADEVHRLDSIELQLRVGLNSGQVIAGEIGSGVPGYTAVGEQVGMAQRMESLAPPGGVMLSESTARLVEHSAELELTQLLHIKGAEKPIPARRLRAIAPHHPLVGGVESSLVGRRKDLATVEALIDRALGGHGAVVGLEGPPGIGKSRLAREAATLSAGRGLEVVWSFCESHACDVPFYAVTRLLRAVMGTGDLEGASARVQVRKRLPDVDDVDLLLLDDLLGISDPAVALPQIVPDARRRRLTALINAAPMARTDSVLYVIEDVHWIDEVSEAMLADFLAVIPNSPSMVLITYRPQYQGILRHAPGAQTIALEPLSDWEISALLAEMVGTDPSVGDLATTVADRAAGNPFFAEEMVRDLVQRGVLTGSRGDYSCHTNVAEVSVPATVQAAIGARIDRLTGGAKRTLNAAAVIGSRFGLQLLTAVGIDPDFDELLAAELIEQVRFAPYGEYTFRHPLIRAVAYESQLKSDRADVHRRLADAIESGSPESADPIAALIAEHLEAAGDLPAAYNWRMRAGAWSTNRDITAARINWERARQIADSLTTDDPDSSAMGIAPRTMLCVSAWRTVHANSSGHFEELRALCAQAGDKPSLAIAMTGLTTELLFRGKVREASRLASEQMAVLDSIGDPTLTIGAAYVAIVPKINTGDIGDVLRWSQTVIDLAEGDPAKGANFAMGSPLAAALGYRGVARYWLGRPGWREDLDDARAMARSRDPITHGLIAAWTYGLAIASGVLRADDEAVCEIEGTLQCTQGFSDDAALSSIRYFLGLTLVHRDAPTDRDRGLELLVQVRDTWLRERTRLYLLPYADVATAREMARRGDLDGAIPIMRRTADNLVQTGQLVSYVLALGTLVETLLTRGAEGDVAEAQAAINRLAGLPSTEGWALRDTGLLRLRAMRARAIGDEPAYRELVNRYRTMAKSLGFEGHMAMAESM